MKCTTITTTYDDADTPRTSTEVTGVRSDEPWGVLEALFEAAEDPDQKVETHIKERSDKCLRIVSERALRHAAPGKPAYHTELQFEPDDGPDDSKEFEEFLAASAILDIYAAD